MDRVTVIGMAVLLSIGFCGGCGGESPTESPEEAATTTTSAAQASVPTEEVTRAASDFLDAVLAGDIQRASARLTPQAMQRIIGSGLQFQPAGQEQAAFRTGEVRMPTKTQALVQFVFTYTAADGSPRSEEGCCLMRLVDGDWRVSGLAYGTGSNDSWTLSDFESGRMIPISRQPTTPPGAAQQAAAPAAGRPSPPRTAQEAAPAVR